MQGQGGRPGASAPNRGLLTGGAFSAIAGLVGGAAGHTGFYYLARAVRRGGFDTFERWQVFNEALSALAGVSSALLLAGVVLIAASVVDERARKARGRWLLLGLSGAGLLFVTNGLFDLAPFGADFLAAWVASLVLAYVLVAVAVAGLTMAALRSATTRPPGPL